MAQEDQNRPNVRALANPRPARSCGSCATNLARSTRSPRHCSISQQAVSQHLKVLKDAGLVAVRQDGPRRLYEVRPEGLGSLEGFLAELWPASLQRLKEDIETDRGG